MPSKVRVGGVKWMLVKAKLAKAVQKILTQRAQIRGAMHDSRHGLGGSSLISCADAVDAIISAPGDQFVAVTVIAIGVCIDEGADGVCRWFSLAHLAQHFPGEFQVEEGVDQQRLLRRRRSDRHCSSPSYPVAPARHRHLCQRV